MDFKFLACSIRDIIIDPVKAWDVIHSENKPVKYLKVSLFIPLITLAAISAFFGSFFFINTELSKAYAVMAGIKYFILFFFVPYATAFASGEIAKKLDLVMDFDLSFKIIIYSVVPFLICQIVSRAFESFIFINVLALYGLFIFWSGIEKMTDPPQNKKIPILIAATICFITLFLTANWLLTMIADKLYFAIFT
jgi:hypothetical protein